MALDTNFCLKPHNLNDIRSIKYHNNLILDTIKEEIAD